MGLEDVNTTGAEGAGETAASNEAEAAAANATANVGVEDGVATDPQNTGEGAGQPAENSDASSTVNSAESAQVSVGEDHQAAPAAEAGAGVPTAGSDPVEKGDLYDNNDELLAAIDAKTGEKVTKAYMDTRLAQVSYAKIDQTVTVCNITLDNGFSVRGESACVEPANFDEKIGRTIAYEDAYRKLWPLFGFRLAEARHLRAKDA